MKRNVQLSPDLAARINAFEKGLGVRGMSAGQVLRELLVRGLDASAMGLFDVIKPGKAKRKGRASCDRLIMPAPEWKAARS